MPRTEPLALVAAAGATWETATAAEREEMLRQLEQQMRQAADELDFELAAQIRDQMMDLKASVQTPGRQDARGTAPGRGRGRRARR